MIEKFSLKFKGFKEVCIDFKKGVNLIEENPSYEGRLVLRTLYTLLDAIRDHCSEEIRLNNLVTDEIEFAFKSRNQGKTFTFSGILEAGGNNNRWYSFVNENLAVDGILYAVWTRGEEFYVHPELKKVGRNYALSDCIVSSGISELPTITYLDIPGFLDSLEDVRADLSSKDIKECSKEVQKTFRDIIAQLDLGITEVTEDFKYLSGKMSLPLEMHGSGLNWIVNNLPHILEGGNFFNFNWIPLHPIAEIQVLQMVEKLGNCRFILTDQNNIEYVKQQINNINVIQVNIEHD